MTARIQGGGEVHLSCGKRKLAFVVPEIFTPGWAKNTPRLNRKDRRTQGQAALPDGTVGLKSAVTAVRDGFRIHMTLTPLSAVQVIHIRVVVNLAYGKWAGVPFSLGSTKAVIPRVPETNNKIGEGDSAVLDLGPNPAFEGRILRMKAPRLHLDLQDNRQWTPYLHAFVTRNEPSDPAWVWKKGVKKDYRFTLSFRDEKERKT